MIEFGMIEGKLFSTLLLLITFSYLVVMAVSQWPCFALPFAFREAMKCFCAQMWRIHSRKSQLFAMAPDEWDTAGWCIAGQPWARHFVSCRQAVWGSHCFWAPPSRSIASENTQDGKGNSLQKHKRCLSFSCLTSCWSQCNRHFLEGLGQRNAKCNVNAILRKENWLLENPGLQIWRPYLLNSELLL